MISSSLVDDWRLTPGFTAFVFAVGSERRVYLASRDKKTHKTPVIKLMGDNFAKCDELSIDLNELDLKFGRIHREWISDVLGIYVRNPEVFPDDSWYRVMNFDESQLPNFFLDLDCNKGEFPGQTFEAVFSETNPEVVSFVCPAMPTYRKYLEEMKRRMNCEFNKKSKKWVPGHRYDTVKETYFYLGHVKSRKTDPNNSEFKGDSDMVDAYLYVNVLRDSDKSISDILKTRTFGQELEDIKVLYSIPSSVESGEVLADDFGSDIEVYWETMINNTIESCKETLSKEYIGYKDTGKLFDILCYQSPDHLEYPKEVVDRYRDILVKLADDALVRCYNLQRSDKNINVLQGNKLEDNVKALERNLYLLTKDGNMSRNAYYPQLFKKLKIDVSAIIRDEMEGWSETRLLVDFDTFKKYEFYFDTRSNDLNITSRQRIHTTTYSTDVTTVKDIFGTGELSEAIINLVDNAKDNFGIGISEYSVYNAGTKKKPNEYVSCVVTLQDIINYAGPNLSDILKQEIMGKRFTRAIVNIDKDKKTE